MAVLAYNCVEWLEIYAAMAKAGLVAVPINFRLVGQEVRYILEDAEVSALILQDELPARSRRSAPTCRWRNPAWCGSGPRPARRVSRLTRT